MSAHIDTKKLKRRISASKYQGDDHYSWAVFIDGLPFVTGLAKDEVSYYKQRAVDRLLKGAGHA